MNHLKGKTQVLRHSKLQRRYRPRQAYKIVPELRISGDWLASAGFKAGEEVAIVVCEDQLIIRPRK